LILHWSTQPRITDSRRSFCKDIRLKLSTYLSVELFGSHVKLGVRLIELLEVLSLLTFKLLNGGIELIGISELHSLGLSHDVLLEVNVALKEVSIELVVAGLHIHRVSLGLPDEVFSGGAFLLLNVGETHLIDVFEASHVLVHSDAASLRSLYLGVGRGASSLKTIVVDDVWAHIAHNSSRLLLDTALNRCWNLALQIVDDVVSFLIWLMITDIHGGIVDWLIHLILERNSITLSNPMVTKSTLDSGSPKFLGLVLLLMITRS
jgi:hypothetical protein